MKRMLMVLLVMAVAQTIMAQDCDNLIADLKKGTLNGVKPTLSQSEIKEKLPCFTGDSEEDGAFNCGGGVFFLDHDFYCYTGRDYIEFRGNFKGKLSVPVLGLNQAQAVKKLALGKAVRKHTNGEKTYIFLKTRYGCLVLTLVANKVTMVSMYAKPAKAAKICL